MLHTLYFGVCFVNYNNQNVIISNLASDRLNQELWIGITRAEELKYHLNLLKIHWNSKLLTRAKRFRSNDAKLSACRIRYCTWGSVLGFPAAVLAACIVLLKALANRINSEPKFCALCTEFKAIIVSRPYRKILVRECMHVIKLRTNFSFVSAAFMRKNLAWWTNCWICW